MIEFLCFRCIHIWSCRTLANALASVLTNGKSSELKFVLHQYAIDKYVFSAGLNHESEDQASILCSGLAVDPWNSQNSAAACHVGNFNQVRVANLVTCILYAVVSWSRQSLSFSCQL